MLFRSLGYDNDEKQDVHHAVLLGSAQEGHMTLTPDQEAARHLYWDQEQGGTPDPGAVWTDTGVTVTIVAAGIYSTSETVTDLSPGETIRLDDQETTFLGYWPTAGTPSTSIQIDPHVSVPNDSALWRFLSPGQAAITWVQRSRGRAR